MADPATTALLAAQDGDPTAFERFVHLTSADVAKYCRFLGDETHADDLAQETYLRTLRSLHSYRGDSPAVRWVLGIARRTCADAIEQRQRSRRTELTRRTPADDTQVVDLELLIADLPDGQREAFVLTQILGYSYEDAADVCACAVGTIRSRVARARATLAANLNGGHSPAVGT